MEAEEKEEKKKVKIRYNYETLNSFQSNTFVNSSSIITMTYEHRTALYSEIILCITIGI